MTTKTKTISALKTFAIQQFHYEKIGLEDTFPSTVPDIDCIKQLHERIDAMAREVYPWYFEQEKPFVSSLASKAFEGVAEQSVDRRDFTHHSTLIPDVWAGPKQPTNGNEQPEEQEPLIQAIQAVKNIKELELYFKVIDKKPEGDEKKELWKIYDEQYDKLQKQPA